MSQPFLFLLEIFDDSIRLLLAWIAPDHPTGALSLSHQSLHDATKQTCLLEGVIVPAFDKDLRSATIDTNSIAWVIYAGPPFTVWQLVESDPTGTVTRRSSSHSDLLLEPVIRAGSCCWMICVQYCADGGRPSFTLDALTEVWMVGVNTLSERFPAILADWPTTAEGIV
jgi:hypothetical protein